MSRTRHIPLLLMVIALLAAPACGRKGPPQPPIKVQPQGSTGLISTQHGDNITLSWMMPLQNTDQSDLVGVTRVELFRYTELLKPKKEGEEDEEETPTNFDVLDQVTQSFLADDPEDAGLYGAGYGTGAMGGPDEGADGKYGGGGQSNTGTLGGTGSSRSGRSGDDRDGWADQQQQRQPRITPGFRDVSGSFISARKFERKAELIHTLTGSQIEESGTSRRLYHTDPLPQLDEETLELTRYHYAVRVTDTMDREGLFSEFQLVTPLVPPVAPHNLQVQSTERSIDLTWDGPPVDPWVRIAREKEELATGPDGDELEPGIPADPGDGKAAAAGAKKKMAAGGKTAPSKGSAEEEGQIEGLPEDAVVPGWIVQPPALFGPASPVRLIALWPEPWPVGPRRPVPPYIAGYYVFRQLESDEGTPTLPSHGQPLIEKTYSNRLFTFGETYRFTVRTVMVTEDGRVESEGSPPVTVTTVDVYPPITPVNFTYVAAAGEVTLFWTPNGEPDLLGYNLYRHKGTSGNAQSELVQLNDKPLDEPRYKDSTVLPETWYTYLVEALDSAEPANRSERSEPLEVMAR